MHLIIGIIGIATALILHEGEASVHLTKGRTLGFRNIQAAGRSSRSRNVTADKAAKPGVMLAGRVSSFDKSISLHSDRRPSSSEAPYSVQELSM